ncbi:hypothetical protein ABPG75_013472 [Micractinium tetrahymenae]
MTTEAWAAALSQLEGLLDGRLMDAARVQSVRLESGQALAAAGRAAVLPPPDAATCRRLERTLSLAGEQLQRLDAALSAATNSSPAAFHQQTCQLMFGVQAAHAGVIMAAAALRESQAARRAVYELAAGVGALVLGSGARQLQLAVACAAVDHAAGLIQGQTAMLSSLLRLLELPWAVGSLPAVARTAFKPAAFLPWLSAAAAAIDCIQPSTAALDVGTSPRLASALAALLFTLWCVLCKHEAFQLGPALAADSAQRQLVWHVAVGALALYLQLPPPGKQGHGDLDLSPHLVPAWAGNILWHGRVFGASWAYCQGGRAPQLLELAEAALQRLLDAGAGASQAGSQPSESVERMQRIACCCGAVSLASAVPSMLIGSYQEGPGQLVRAELDAVRAAIRERTVRLVPRVAAALQLCLAGDVLDAAAACELLYLAIPVVAMPQGHPVPAASTAAQAADWCRAADACLRLLPLLAKLHAKLGNSPPVPLPGISGADPAEVLAHLTTHCLAMWPGAQSLVVTFQESLRSVDRAFNQAATELAEPLWTLHTTACRTLHWLAAQGGSPDLPTALRSPDWQRLAKAASLALQYALLDCMLLQEVAVAEGGGSSEEAAELRRRAQGMCATHAELLPVLSEKLGLPISQLALGAGLKADLQLATAVSPQLLVTPELAAAYVASTRAMWEDKAALPNPVDLLRFVRTAVNLARRWPRFAALLISSGLLAHGLQLAAQAELEVPSAREQCWQLVRSTLLLCSSFPANCDSAAAEGQRPTWPSYAAAMADLSAATESCNQELGADPAPSPSAMLQRYQRHALPAATALAVAMQQHWGEPEQQAAGPMELAAAVGTRSCAYLRCANLAGAGGPAAGQGDGSKRCGACRAVWYCGTDCSHADWARRGWHRRVCKALTAEREAAAAGAAETG